MQQNLLHKDLLYIFRDNNNNMKRVLTAVFRGMKSKLISTSSRLSISNLPILSIRTQLK